MNAHINIISIALLSVAVGCDSKQSSKRPQRVPPDVSQPWHSDLESTRTVVVDGHILNFKLILPGSFVMGNNDYYRAPGTLGRQLSMGSAFNQGPERVTTITQPFYMLETEAMAALYCVYLNQSSTAATDVTNLHASIPNRVELVNGTYQPRAGCRNHAANSVTWAGAVGFCQWLSQQSDMAIQLPTEAQWAYAARGPQSWKYTWGPNYFPAPQFDRHEQFVSPSTGSPVMAYPQSTTPTGLYDMWCGVPEWTLDGYVDSYNLSTTIDPFETTAWSKLRVLRGRRGITFREGISPRINPDLFTGIRPILVIEPPGETADSPQ